MSKRAIYVVNVAGQNISARLRPLLISLSVTDQEGSGSDTCSIKLDDKNGQLALPRDGDPITILLGWEGGGVSLVFTGTIDEVRSSGSRGSGRELSISGKGVDTKGQAKEGQQMHMDDATVSDALNKAGKKAGISVKVDPALAKVKRAWWGLNDESFLHFGERVARELGGIFKVQGNQAILAKKGSGSVSGGAMGFCYGIVGQNLIDWDIAPTLGRPRHKEVVSRFYDIKKAKWDKATEKTNDSGAKSALTDRYSRTDKDEAQSASENGARDSEREKGGGSATIDGNVAAKAGGKFVLGGARSGVDGLYRIRSATHDLTRSGGWTTKVDLIEPQG